MATVFFRRMIMVLVGSENQVFYLCFGCVKLLKGLLAQRSGLTLKLLKLCHDVVLNYQTWHWYL